MSDYELLDFGSGRKLERFGVQVVDRPAPAAESAKPSRPELWSGVVARYERTGGDEGRWVGTWPEAWHASFPMDSADIKLTFELRPSPFGHLGVFPEQAENWLWINRQVQRAGRPMRVLNLFAYTGGSTLAAAAAGAEVVHIDAAQNIVERARRNAELSGLADRSIRWIAEDAVKFCQREVKRGNRYDAVILDPPSYGHGPKGEPWKINDHLLTLLKLCSQLTEGTLAFALVTCHSPGIGPAELAAYLAEGLFGHCGQPPTAGELALVNNNGRRLPCGVYARWP